MYTDLNFNLYIVLAGVEGGKSFWLPIYSEYILLFTRHQK
jgi:hypothetical protein